MNNFRRGIRRHQWHTLACTQQCLRDAQFDNLRILAGDDDMCWRQGAMPQTMGGRVIQPIREPPQARQRVSKRRRAVGSQSVIQEFSRDARCDDEDTSCADAYVDDRDESGMLRYFADKTA